MTFFSTAAQVLPFFVLSAFLDSGRKSRMRPSIVDGILVGIQFLLFAAGEWVALAVIHQGSPASDRQTSFVTGALVASGAALGVRILWPYFLGKHDRGQSGA